MNSKIACDKYLRDSALAADVPRDKVSRKSRIHGVVAIRDRMYYSIRKCLGTPYEQMWRVHHYCMMGHSTLIDSERKVKRFLSGDYTGLSDTYLQAAALIEDAALELEKELNTTKIGELT